MRRMKITRIETFPVRVPIRPEFQIRGSLGFHTESPFLMIRVHTDEGVSGVGEVSCTPLWSGEDQVTAAHLISNFVAPALMGQDPLEIERLQFTMRRAVAANPFTKSGIEMAMWENFEQWLIHSMLVTIACAAPLIAGLWDSDAATASALRWLVGGYLIAASLPIWCRSYVANWWRRFSRAETLDRFESLARESRIVLFTIGITPILALTIYPALATIAAGHGPRCSPNSGLAGLAGYTVAHATSAGRGGGPGTGRRQADFRARHNRGSRDAGVRSASRDAGVRSAH